MKTQQEALDFWISKRGFSAADAEQKWASDWISCPDHKKEIWNYRYNRMAILVEEFMESRVTYE